MKLFAFFATAILAEDNAYAADPTNAPAAVPTQPAPTEPEPVDIDIVWPGQTEINPCGSQVMRRPESAVNSTCTISYPDNLTPFRKFLGGMLLRFFFRLRVKLVSGWDFSGMVIPRKRI